MEVFVGIQAEVSCRGILVRTVTLRGSFRTKWICSICRYTRTSLYFCVLFVELLAVNMFCSFHSRKGISLEQLLSAAKAMANCSGERGELQLRLLSWSKTWMGFWL